MNIICWFEIYVGDMERAKKFYSSVFGFSFRDADGPGDAGDMRMAFFPSEDPEKDVTGALIQMSGTKTGDGKCVNTMVYFPTKDCITEEKKIEAAGGKVTRSKFSIGEYGYCSICVDSEGNPFGLFSME